MIPRLLLALLFLALSTGCSLLPYFKTKPAPADKTAAVQPMTPGEKKARVKELKALIKVQEKTIERYHTQDPANKKPDPLYFVSDKEYEEAQTRLAKEQVEAAALAGGS